MVEKVVVGLADSAGVLEATDDDSETTVVVPAISLLAGAEVATIEVAGVVLWAGLEATDATEDAGTEAVTDEATVADSAEEAGTEATTDDATVAGATDEEAAELEEP